VPPYSLFSRDLDHVLDRTRDAWEELRAGRIFITGGTGFFGMWLLESFLWANERLALGARATVLSRNPTTFLSRSPHLAAHSAVELVAGDVCNFQFPAGTFTHLIHAATEASAQLNEQSPRRMLETIVTGTQRTLDFAIAARAGKFLLTSSGAVYGRQPSDMTHVPEDYQGGPDPFSPTAAYGEGKRVAELLCAIAARTFGLETKIARCFAFVGPYLPLDAHFAVGNFLRDVLHNRPITVGGDGTPFRSYLYAADLAVWLWTILFQGESCHPYNVGSDESLSIRDIALATARAGRQATEVRVAQTARPGAPASRYVPAVERARRELGLNVTIPFSDALERTLAWHQTTSTARMAG
jgi:dTDP-glucose 4,6-dehydratase